MKFIQQAFVTTLSFVTITSLCAQAPTPQMGPPGTTPVSLTQLQTENARLTEKVAELERRVAALEAQAKLTGPRVDQPPQGTAATADVATDVPLVLDGWDYRFVPGTSGQNSYYISVTLRNVSAKGIKLVDASVQFTDLLNQSLYGIAVGPDLVIPPGSQKIDAGEYHINQYMNQQLRMKDMAKDDVKAKLVVRRVVFSDNTIFEIKR
jgi:hypothetical protein